MEADTAGCRACHRKYIVIGGYNVDKLKVVVVSEASVTNNMAGCGRNIPALCGTRECSFNGGNKDD